jgi:methyl-accepting chemotaxis protein
MNADTTPAAGRRHSLRWHLLVPLNVAVVVIAGAFMAWDAFSEWRYLLEEKRATLQREAETLLPAAILLQDKLETLQRYVDEVCAKAQVSSAPGHHIAVAVGGDVIQARSDHQDPAGTFRSMGAAAAAPQGKGPAEGSTIVSGGASREGVSVYVSERLDEVYRVLRREMLRRLANLLFLATAIGLVVNVLASRLVDRPLRAIVESVRRIKAGGLGAQAPPLKTEELGFLADEINTMSAALAEADGERREQMAKARRIQEHLHPAPAAIAWPAMVCSYEPSSEVGGDYFDVVQRNGGPLLLCMADVSGHGVPAAMGAAVLKAVFVQASAGTDEPARILASIGKAFTTVAMEEDFATMIVLAVDRAAGKLRYANAGHPPGHLLRPGEPIIELPATGPPLGIAASSVWDTMTLDIRPGDRLVLVTDGIEEAMGPQNGRFGAERFDAALDEYRRERLDLFCTRVGQRVHAFRGSAPQSDDMTMLVAEF